MSDIEAQSQELVPGSPEYNSEMAARSAVVAIRGVQHGTPAETQQEAPAAPERPSWPPAKFQSAEDMAKAYAALESKLGAPAAPVAPAAPATPATPEAAVQAAGLDMSALSAEFAEQGELSTESYAALEKAGIPRAMVDAYVDGQVAVAERQAQSAMQSVGGEQAYRQMTGWAKANFSPAEVASFDRAVNSGDPGLVSMAVSSLQARYHAANGRLPSLVRPDGAVVPGTNGFRSTAEMTAAMSDPRYGRDTAYTRDVEQRAQGLQNLTGISVRVIR